MGLADNTLATVDDYGALANKASVFKSSVKSLRAEDNTERTANPILTERLVYRILRDYEKIMASFADGKVVLFPEGTGDVIKLVGEQGIAAKEAAK